MILYLLSLAVLEQLQRSQDLNFASTIHSTELTTMSSMPYAMHMANKEKQRQQRKFKQEDIPSPLDLERTENTLKYPCKMMNSIWGEYNKYSVHNLKSTQTEHQQSRGDVTENARGYISNLAAQVKTHFY